jgi:hypothetical protein
LFALKSDYEKENGHGWKGIVKKVMACLILLIVSSPISLFAFNDVTPDYWAYSYIQMIYNDGITVGCGNGDYCPTEDVTRDQMAAFLIRALGYGDNPTCNGGIPCSSTVSYFSDVPSSDYFFPYVQKLYEIGVTTGCGDGDYCSLEGVTRDQMAAFLIRAVGYGDNPTCNGGIPCSSTVPYFSDVPPSDYFFPYVQKLYEIGVTTGCGDGDYCSLEGVTRDQMAAFIYRAFLGSPQDLCTANAPSQQPAAVNHETTDYPTPPAGYNAVIAWANATIGENGPTIGTVTVQFLEIHEKYAGNDNVISSSITCPLCDSEDHIWGYTLLKTSWQNPSAWSGSNDGNAFAISPEGYVIAPVGNKPLYVYHFWNTIWPRPVTMPGAQYYVKAQVKVEGNAMLQIGLDYWMSPNGGTNVQAATSNWTCAASGWQTVQAGAYK